MIRIYGYSDDNVEIEGDVRGEIGCYDTPVTLRIGTDVAGLYVIAQYDVHGVGWLLGVATVHGDPDHGEDDGEIPWPVRVEREKYSTAIVIECPPGTPCVYRKDKGDAWEVPS